MTATSKQKKLLIFLLLFAPLLVYMNSLQNGFVFDDKFVLEQNPYVRDMGNIPSYFVSSKTQSSYDMKNYRPLRQVMFTLEYRLFGLNPAPYHMSNILLHALNGLLLFLFLNHLGLSHLSAFLASILFAVHPVNTEAVANVTGRTDLLFFFFYIIGLLLYLKSHESQNRVFLKLAVLIAYIFALFSKEMAITFPIILFLTDLFRNKGGVRNLKKNLPFYFSLIVISVAYLALRTYALEGIAKDTSAFYGDSHFTRLISQTAVFITYLRLVFVPHPLSARYDLFLLESPFNPYTAASVILLAALTVATFVSFKKGRSPLPLFGCWWFLIALLPVSNIIPLQGAMMGGTVLPPHRWPHHHRYCNSGESF